MKKYLDKIIEADCIELMKSFPDQSIDLVLTDPPYNAKNIGPNERTYSLGQMQLPPEKYIAFCNDWIQQALRIGKRVVFTPGIANVCYYPQPNWIIAWSKPQAVSFNRYGGFNVWEPIMIYGKAAKGKRIPRDLIQHQILNLSSGPEKGHPCPKPPLLMGELIDKFTNEGDIILDPFNGSGTTCYMAKRLGRHFIGIDINPAYNKIAELRLAQEVMFPA